MKHIKELEKTRHTTRQWRKNWLLRFGFAVILVVVAAWLYQKLAEITQGQPPLFISFYPAIIIAAVIGGFGPGLLATLLSVTSAVYFFIVPAGSFTIESEGDRLSVIVFLLMGLVISLLAESVLRANKHAEETLFQANAYNRSLLEASLDPLVTISADGLIMDVNEAAQAVTGMDRAQLIGSDFSDYFTEPEQARAGYQRVFSQGYVTDYPLAIRHVSGKVTDVLYNASIYRNPQGEVAGVFAAARDVTDRKLAEQKLHESALYTRSLIEASLDPLVTISAKGQIMDVNEATIGVTGVSREELIGSDFSNYFTEPEQARTGYQRVFSQGYVTNYPLAIRHVSGKVTDVLYNASVFRNPQGEVAGVFAAARDVTDRKLAEQKLQASLYYTRSLIEASMDLMVTISMEGKIISVNEAAVQITGIDRDQLIGSDFSRCETGVE